MKAFTPKTPKEAEGESQGGCPSRIADAGGELARYVALRGAVAVLPGADVHRRLLVTHAAGAEFRFHRGPMRGTAGSLVAPVGRVPLRGGRGAASVGIVFR